jgi:hypothetical protein
MNNKNELKENGQPKTSTILKPFGQRLSTGKANLRYKGTLRSNSIQQSWSDQSNGVST